MIHWLFTMSLTRPLWQTRHFSFEVHAGYSRRCMALIDMFCQFLTKPREVFPVKETESLRILQHCRLISAQATKTYFFLILTWGCVYWFEREKRGNEKKTLIGCLPYAPWLGTKRTTWVCALTTDQTPNILVNGMALQQTDPPSQGRRKMF